MPFVLLLSNDRKRITDNDRRRILEGAMRTDRFVRLDDGSWVNVAHIVSIEKS